MKPDEQEKPRKVIPIKAETTEGSSFYEAHKKVYPRSISGYFMRWRWVMVFLTQLVFYGLHGWSGGNGRWCCLI